METFEDKIKQQNEEAKAAARAAEKEAKAAARAEKIDNALSSVKKAVLSPFEKIKAGIEKAKAEQKFQEQCQGQYETYMARANETAHLVGTVEEQVAENGDQITTVYTENGPIIRTNFSEAHGHGVSSFDTIRDVQYEGIITQKIDGVDQLVYSKISYLHQSHDRLSDREEVSGITQTEDGFTTIDAYRLRQESPFVCLENAFNQAYQTATAAQTEAPQA